MPSRPASAEPTLRRLRIASAIALVTFVGFIAVITLWPGPPAAAGQGWLRDFLRQAHAHGLPRWITFGKIEFGSNILMFVPVGLFGALALPRHRWLIVPAALVASAGIETVQAMALPLRYATVRDVIANTTGALVGYLLAVAIVGYLHRRARRVHPSWPAPIPALPRQR
ncbi:MAG TPA: VanZ family protein [Nakamurella sp.]